MFNEWQLERLCEYYSQNVLFEEVSILHQNQGYVSFTFTVNSRDLDRILQKRHLEEAENEDIPF